MLQIDQRAVEIALHGGEAWQSISLRPGDFLDASGGALADWTTASELAIGPSATLRQGEQTRTLGAAWQGELPTFRQVRWELESER